MYPPLPRSAIQLDDGRLIGYAEFGAPNGTPVLLFHDTPGSRLIGQFFHNAAAERDVRLIALDRPGFGLSTFQPKRTLRDWPKDVASVAGELGIERFGIVAVGGGGPHALACGASMAEQVSAIAISGGVGPVRRGTTSGMSLTNRAVLRIARRAALPLRLPLSVMSGLAQRYPDRLVSQVTRSMAKVDREILAGQDMRAVFSADLAEGLRGGAKGMAHELSMLAKPWGIRVEDVAARVHFWHGESDRNVPPAMSKALLRTVNGSGSTFVPEAGHLVFVSLAGEVLASVIGK